MRVRGGARKSEVDRIFALLDKKDKGVKELKAEFERVQAEKEKLQEIAKKYNQFADLEAREKRVAEMEERAKDKLNEAEAEARNHLAKRVNSHEAREAALRSREVAFEKLQAQKNRELTGAKDSCDQARVGYEKLSKAAEEAQKAALEAINNAEEAREKYSDLYKALENKVERITAIFNE